MKELMLVPEVRTDVAKILSEPPPRAEIVEVPNQEEVIRGKIEELKNMGFHKAAKRAESAHKMSLAYDGYTFITRETIDRFNDRLKKETLEEDKRARRYKQLMFIQVEQYEKMPPAHVLEAMSKARKKEIFDRFLVGKIDWKEEIKDPILFGQIDGCPDLFYIAQWDNDVTIEELLSV